MKLIAHIRASVCQTKNGYGATLHISETEGGSYKLKTKIERVTPKDAIYDAMREAQEIAEQNYMIFKPTYANAGDVYETVKPQQQEKAR